MSMDNDDVDQDEMRSFNQMSNSGGGGGYFRRELQKQRSATIHIRSTSRINNDRGTVIQEEELQQQSDGRESSHQQ